MWKGTNTRLWEVNVCLSVHVCALLFFVQPQRSIKEVLGACQCAPVKVLRAEWWTSLEWLNSGCLTGGLRPGFIRRRPGWQQPGSSHQLQLCQAKAQALVLESFPIRISTRCLAGALAESNESVGMQSYRKCGKKSWMGKVCLLFAILVLLHKSSWK